MPTSPPTVEIGHVSSWTQLPGWSVLANNAADDTEESPEWVWPQSVRTVDRMRRNSQVRSTWWALSLPLRGDIWALDAQAARPEVVERIAEDFDLPTLDAAGRRRRRVSARRKGRFSWPEHVGLAIESLLYGHAYFEQLYDADAFAATGQARLRKLAPRFQQSISGVQVAADGGLESIRQWSPRGSGQTPPIGVDRLVAYTNERRGANWFGSSILRAVYGDWLLLDRLVRVRAMTMERNGMGVPVGVAPPGVTDQTRIDEYGDIAARARAGEFSGIGLPHGADVRFRGVEGTLPDIGAAIADHRAMIAEGVQASFMKLGRTESGNRALGETLFDAFAMALNAVASSLADTATQHAIEDYVDLNWGEDEPAPAVVAMPIDAERDIPPESLVGLVQSGAIRLDDDMRRWVRQRYRLPAEMIEAEPDA